MTARTADYRFLAILLIGLAAVSERLAPASNARADDAAQGQDAPKVEKAENAPAAEAAPGNAQIPARFLTVSGVIDERMVTRITNTALALQNDAVQRNRDAVLVLEITRGASRFGLVSDIAKFLTSAKVSRVRTVAFVSERLDGNNVILALACKEIIMHPDSEIGDIGRGETVDNDEQQTVFSLIDKRHNPKLSPAIAAGMMDPQMIVLKVTVQKPGEEAAETRVVTRDELDRLRQNQIAIRDVQTLKEGGVVGLFTAGKARDAGVILTRTAETRGEVAEALNLPRESLHEDPTHGDTLRVRLIKMEGEIDDTTEAFLERQIRRAVDSGANLIIFEIDSMGGGWVPSNNLSQAIARLDPKVVKTVAWVPERAISGAAMIALGCDEIYMEPHAILGDVIPITSVDGIRFERVPEKMLSIVKPSLADLAERKGRSTALAMSMADKDLDVYQVTHKETGRVAFMTEAEIHVAGNLWIKGPIVPETQGETALTVNGTRAHELKLAERPVADFEELKKRLGIGPDQIVTTVERTWVDDFIFFLNSGTAMFLLLVIGIVCLYMELHLMTGILGIISAVCFALFFWSRFLGGTAGWLEVILFLLGITCIAMEIFVIPGFGVFGISGGLLLIGSLIMASQTFGSLEPGADMHHLSKTVGTLTGAVVSVVVIGILLSRYLPSIPFLNQMILTPPGYEEASHGPRLDPSLGNPASGAVGTFRSRGELIGKRGSALTMLRPAGKAEIDGQFLDVVSEGAFLDPGTAIEVVQVEGNRVIVRRAES